MHIRHIDAFNARNLDALLQVMAPNCVVEGLAYSDTIRGAQVQMGRCIMPRTIHPLHTGPGAILPCPAGARPHRHAAGGGRHWWRWQCLCGCHVASGARRRGGALRTRALFLPHRFPAADCVLARVTGARRQGAPVLAAHH